MATSSKRKDLEHLIASVLGRELGTRTIMFHQALANRAGVALTDLKCLDYMDRTGGATAGDLARLTGLTTGAITAAIDRLERAGLARRERCQEDRRKVIVKPRRSTALAELVPFYQALAREMEQLVSGYTTEQLATIRDFCERCIDIMRSQMEAVQQSGKEKSR
jgi:DNA-binding MarR family transcriptional regulator